MGLSCYFCEIIFTSGGEIEDVFTFVSRLNFLHDLWSDWLYPALIQYQATFGAERVLCDGMCSIFLWQLDCIRKIEVVFSFVFRQSLPNNHWSDWRNPGLIQLSRPSCDTTNSGLEFWRCCVEDLPKRKIVTFK